MDTANFLLERQEIEKRMDERRLETTQQVTSARSGMLSWLLLTSAGVVSGFRSSPVARRLVRTLLWATVAPVVLGVINRRNDGILHRLIDALFPSSRPSEPVSK